MKESPVQFFDRIQTSKNLPSLPQILIRLIKLCDNEESKIEDISQIINKDASLSAKVMDMAHSPYYGRSKRVGNIDQAIETLGTRAIKNIALITSDIQVFSKPEDNYVLYFDAYYPFNPLENISSFEQWNSYITHIDNVKVVKEGILREGRLRGRF